MATTKSFFDQDSIINFSKKQVSNLQEMNELAQKAIARFLNAGRLEEVLTGLRTNIAKFQACPIISKVENKDLQELYVKLKSLFPT